MKSTLQKIAFVLFLLTVFVSAKAAGTKTWIGSATGGVWTTTGNWNGGTPVAGDDVVITPTANMTITGFVTLASNGTLNSLRINGTGGTYTVNIANGSQYLTIATLLNIELGNILDVGTLRLNATGSNFTTLGTGVLKIQNTSYTPTGKTWTFDVIYNGSAAQQISGGTYNNLTIDNSTTIGTVAGYVGGGDLTITGTLTLTRGMLACSNSIDGSSGTLRNIFMNAGSSLVGGSSNSYILASGTFVRKSVGTSSLVYPLGTAAGYSPLTITNTSGNPDITTKLKTTFTNAPFDATKVVNLEWYIMSSATTTANITYQFNSSNFASGYSVSAASEVGIYKTFYTATSLGTATGSNPYTLSTTSVGLSTTAIYNVIGNIGSVMNPNKDYLWNGTTLTDYQVASNWTPARNVPSSLDNLTITPSTTTSITNVPSQTINSLTINGTGTNTVTLGGTNTLTIGASGTVNITSGNTLDMESFRLSAVGDFTTTGTGALITANTNGVPQGTSGLSWSFDVIYNGSATQAIPKGTYTNFTLNNTTALSSPAANIAGGDATVTGTLTLTKGILACGTGTGRNLNIATIAIINGAGNQSYVYTANGTIIRKSVGTSSLLYPVGTLSSYTPLTITNLEGSPNITVKLKFAITNAVFDATKVVNLEWSVLSTVATTANITYQFNGSDFASGYSVGSVSELGNFKTSYTTSSVGIASGNNPYTLTSTGLSIPATGNNFYVIGNTNGIVLTISSDSNLSSYSPTSATDVKVSAGYELTVNADASVKSITVAPGAKLTLTSGTLAATNGITLESDVTGTATLMDSYSTPTINATVKQFVTAGRNWYMSAPLNNTADYSVLNKGASVAEYNEITGLWPAVTSGTLTRGKGYVEVASATEGSTGTVSFNGTTNSGDVLVTLTNTLAGGKGFNLVGNPYPSYLSWSAIAADNTAANMPTGTMWYRTISYNNKSAWAPNTAYNLNDIVYNGTRFYKATSTGTSGETAPTGGVGTIGISDGVVTWDYFGSVYIFATISASGVATPATVSNLVPPMQAFWVKSTGGTLTFKNAMRSHNTGGTNALKAPKNSANDIQLLRLNVTNGASADEAVIYASTDATNAFDSYDAPKYFNLAGSNQPEIYTQVGEERLVINAMNEITLGTEIPFGFATEKGNNFTISSSEFRNFGSDVKVMLKDKQFTSEFDLTTGQSYAFSSDVVNSTDRFSLIFRTAGIATGFDNATKMNAQVFVNIQNQIVIVAPEKSNYAIYNPMGKLIENGILNTKTRNAKFGAGIYFVQLSINGHSEVKKVIIR